MSWTKHLPTPYHQQDTDYYCGAATAQMILDSIGSGVLNQNMLYASNHAHSSSGWATSPDGLNFTLNQYMPPPPVFDSFFIVERGDSEPVGSENIVRTLYVFGVATGTLVYDCGHWVVVRGVQTDVEPAYGSTYSIEGFWINNPWPPTPSFYTPSLAPPPPHADPDLCGTGGDRGIADEYVTYSSWQSDYHTGCDAYGVGHRQFISVCDPRQPPLGTLQLRGYVRMAKGDQIISSEQAVELALRGIEEHRLNKEGVLSKVLQHSRPTHAQLVHRLDRPDDFYYLVTLHHGDKATALVRLDALEGTFQGVHALKENEHHGIVEEIAEHVIDVIKHREHPTIIDRESMLHALLAHPIDLGPELGQLRIREGAFCIYPTLVWRPCMESRSPYYPFYQVTVGSSVIYVGYDGRIYPALHDLGRG